MGESSKIQWTHHTFNPWIGCEKVSPGCKNCYASVDTYARVSASRGLPLWGPGSSRHVTADATWRKPFSWNKAAAKAGERHRVFCASLADVFEDRPDLLVPRARLAMLIANTPHLDWLLLTKRPENAARMWRVAFGGGLAPASMNPWLPNIWLGTTVEDQAHADERIPHLLAVPAVVRFVSYEPALGPVDFTDIVTRHPNCEDHTDALHCDRDLIEDDPFGGATVSWIIVGGESGPAARPFRAAWAQLVIDQCATAGAAAFVKQMGARLEVDDLTHWRGAAALLPDASGHRVRLKDSHGGEWDEWPAELRVRQFPEVRRG